MPCSIARPAGPLAVLTALALLLPPDPPAAEARTAARNRAVRAASVASRQARSDALAPPEDPSGGVGIAPTPPAAPEAPVREFSADVLLPALWNTDPEQAPTGTPSPELTPEGRLTWSRLLASLPLRVSAVADASADRYRQAPDANSDLVYGRVRVQYESGADDQEWQPFASLTPTYIFTTPYAKRVDTWYDIAAGLAKTWEWDGTFRRIPRGADTEAQAVWTVALNGGVQRRERDGGPESWALLINPSVTWAISERWNASLEFDVTRRWFDPYGGRGRRDWLLTPVLTVERTWPEDWLPPQDRAWGRALGTPVLDFQVFATREISTRPEARFRQWGVGPVLRTAWKF